MDVRGRLLLALRLGPHDASSLRVRGLRGREALSEPFRFEVDFLPASGEPLELPPLLGAEAAITMARPDGLDRSVHGLCARIEHTGVHSGRPAYRATVVPKLALLGETLDSRVFQGKSALAIVKEVLDAHGVEHREAVSGAGPAREMCLQYRESDLAFVSRLLEEEGIAYWFEHADDRHVMVLGDQARAFAGMEGGEELPFRAERDSGVDLERLTSLRIARRMKPARIALRDYDFERPGLTVEGHAAGGEGTELQDWPAGALAPSRVTAIARMRLEEARLPAETWEGTGTCARLVPGAVFAAEDHPDPTFCGRLVAVRVEHEGEQPTERDATQVAGAYHNRFLAVAADRPYRPARRTPRPRIAGVQTATAMGPAGEEIHPDQHGRIRIRFHWDREGPRDDKASAWVRTSQAWSGPGLGAVFVPRAGQEVLVRFLEGDPDRPLVTGALYNGDNTSAVALPDDRTWSALRTDSSPHSGGYNELRFEDQQGAEEIYLQAERDELLETENDKRQRIDANEQLEVGKDRTQGVGGAQRLEVRGEDGTEVVGDRTLGVIGDRTTEVFGDHREAIAGNHAAAVGGERHVSVLGAGMETVLAAAALTVGGAYAVSVAAAENVAVGGLLNRRVGGNAREWVGAAREAQVGGDDRHKVGGKDVVDVRGGLRSTVGKDLSEKVEKILEVEAKEPVGWTANGIQLEAEKLNLVVGGKLLLTMSGGAVTFGATTFTANGAAVAVKGATVSKVAGQAPPKAAPKVTKLEKLDPRRPLVEVDVTDQDGKPLANVRVRIEMPDGSIQVVRSDGAGHAVASAPCPGAVRISLPDHDASIWEKS